MSQCNDIDMLLMSIHCILSDKDLFLCLRLELDINIVLGVEHLPSDFAGKVIFNHLIDYREALVYGHHIFALVTLLACILEILRHEFGEFLIGKVVLKILVDGRRLDGQRLVLIINDNSMGSEYMLEKFWCSIKSGSHGFVQRFCQTFWTSQRSWLRMNLQVMKRVGNLCAFIIKAVCSTFKFSWFQPSIRTVNYNRC